VTTADNDPVRPNISYALDQQLRAQLGEADGQCECGSFRLDGKPPALHHQGCARKHEIRWPL
jgi:hypothetical protein